MEKTRITLEENKLVFVERLSNAGLCLGKKHIRLDDLLIALMSIMETNDLAKVLIKDNNQAKNIIGPILSHTEDKEEIDALLDILLERVEEEKNMCVLAAIFKALASHFDLAAIDEKSLNRFLELLLQKTNTIKNTQVFESLLNTLLKKLPIADMNGTQASKVLELLLQKGLMDDNEDTVHALFQVLSRKARKNWMMQVLAPYLQQQKIVRSPILPKSCVLYQEELDTTEIVVIEVEKQHFDTIYYKTEFKQVGYPKLLFSFAVKNEQATCKLFAIKDTVIKPETKLYRYPFSNVFDNFGTCWPDLNHIPIRDLYQLSTLPFLFISSPNNDHAFRGCNLREMFASLENADFDNDLLEYTEHTFEDYFELVEVEKSPTKIENQDPEEYELGDMDFEEEDD